MLEETDNLVFLGEKDKPPTLFQSFKFYLTRPKIFDWIIGVLCIGAVIATIIICVI